MNFGEWAVFIIWLELALVFTPFLYIKDGTENRKQKIIKMIIIDHIIVYIGIIAALVINYNSPAIF